MESPQRGLEGQWRAGLSEVAHERGIDDGFTQEALNYSATISVQSE
jgi:hypothetical protein